MRLLFLGGWWGQAPGALLTGGSFLLLIFVPVDFAYWEFALVIALNGFGSGLFFSPNWTEMMNSVPFDRRGADGGMIATFQNSAFVLFMSRA